MSTVSRERLELLLQPYLEGGSAPPSLPDNLYEKLGVYLDLLLRWNARTNLTAVREPDEMVRRHFGESLFAGLCLRAKAPESTSLLDLGSGAGFPGVPIQLLWPELAVTLAESQGKKAAFLREVVRALDLRTAVWAHRVEAMALDQRFDVVTLRAVDRMEAMVAVGRVRLRPGGWLVQLVGAAASEWGDIQMPGRSGGYVRVTRGTD